MEIFTVMLVFTLFALIVLWIISLIRKARKRQPFQFSKFIIKPWYLSIVIISILVFISVTGQEDVKSNNNKVVTSSPKENQSKKNPKKNQLKKGNNKFKSCEFTNTDNSKKACDMHKSLANNKADQHIDRINITQKDAEFEIDKNTVLVDMYFKDLSTLHDYLIVSKQDSKKQLEEMHKYINSHFNKDDTTLINLNMMLSLKQTNGLGDVQSVTPSMLSLTYDNSTLNEVNWKIFKDSNKYIGNSDIVNTLTPSKELEGYLDCLERKGWHTCDATPSLYK